MKLIRNILFVFLPLICAGTIVCYIISPFVLNIVAGKEYIEAAQVFRVLLPILIMSFPVAILGWPALGSINKVKETTLSTIYGAIVQVIGIILLLVSGNFTIINIAILRNLSESVMLLARCFYLLKYRDLFNNSINTGVNNI